MLFVPGNKEAMLAKSLATQADALIWDLEDAVAAGEKDRARTTIGNALRSLNTSKPIYVRINSLEAGMLKEDLEHIVQENLYGVMLSKAESPSQVHELADTLTALEEKRGLARRAIRIHCILETCLGIVHSYAIASASLRIDGVSFGAEDFTLDLGTSRTRDGGELALARGTVGLAAGAAKIQAIDTVYSDLNDDEGLVKECRAARAAGFRGKFALHPKQIAIINREFSPTPAELAYAEKVVAAFNSSENLGVITVDGKMVDRPVFERARQMLLLRRES